MFVAYTGTAQVPAGNAGWLFNETTGELHGVAEKKSGPYAVSDDGYTDLNPPNNPLLSE